MFALALGCGGGSDHHSSLGEPPLVTTPSPGSPEPTPASSPIACDNAFEQGEVFVAVAQIFGVTPTNGTASTKRVLIRSHGGEADVVDFAGGNEPHWRGLVFFSSPTVAWSWSEEANGAALLRSDDAGVTWHRVSSIPRGATQGIDLHVDEQRGLAFALLRNQGLGSFGTPGPYVFRGRLGTDDWQQLDIPPSEWLKPYWFGLGARDGRVEVARWWPTLQIYDVTDEVVAKQIDVDEQQLDADETFRPTEYATFMDRGWIGGTIESQSAGGVVPAVLVSDDADPWRLVPVDGVAVGRVTTLDFASAEQGIVCGPTDSAGFCAFSEDGGRSWTRAALPGPYFIHGAARSSCGAGVIALASIDLGVRSSLSVLTSVDGGRSWSEQVLPRFAAGDIGPVARNSRPGASTSQVAIAPPPALDLPVPVALAPGAPGPVVWAAGDSVERGPTIMGLLLRSEDAGSSWVPVLGVPGGSLSSVALVDRLNGWVVGAGRILRTRDGGATFADQTDGIPLEGAAGQTRLVSARDAEHAIVVARGLPAGAEFERDVVVVTSDGGESWRVAAAPVLETPGSAGIGDACLAGSGAGMLVAEMRVLLTRDGGETWDFGPDFPFFRPDSGANGEGFTDPALYCSGRDDLWIVTSDVDPRRDTLWHSPNGGRTWLDLSEAVGVVPEFGRPVASFLASGSGWIVLPRRGEPPQVLRTQDGGALWTALASPFLEREQAVAMAFSDDRHGVILTSQRRTLTTMDGGETWVAGSAPADFAPLALGIAQ